mgnify:CR=1 FL=1
MTELVKVADIDKTHKNPIAELVQIVILRLRAKEKISMPKVLWGLWHLV